MFRYPSNAPFRSLTGDTHASFQDTRLPSSLIFAGSPASSESRRCCGLAQLSSILASLGGRLEVGAGLCQGFTNR